jgi:hypothetical protein
MRLPWLQNALHRVQSRRGLWHNWSYKLRGLVRGRRIIAGPVRPGPCAPPNGRLLGGYSPE